MRKNLKRTLLSHVFFILQLQNTLIYESNLRDHVL
jgi:hypothetical protein